MGIRVSQDVMVRLLEAEAIRQANADLQGVLRVLREQDDSDDRAAMLKMIAELLGVDDA